MRQTTGPDLAGDSEQRVDVLARLLLAAGTVGLPQPGGIDRPGVLLFRRPRKRCWAGRVDDRLVFECEADTLTVVLDARKLEHLAALHAEAQAEKGCQQHAAQ